MEFRNEIEYLLELRLRQLEEHRFLHGEDPTKPPPSFPPIPGNPL